MTDLDRVLDSLLHDLRSPLGVASGYLRLVREGRLTDPHETERVLGKAQDALRVMGALCADASVWLAPEPPGRLSHQPAAVLVAAVTDRLSHDGVTVATTAPGDARVVTLHDDGERVASAIATVLARVVQDREFPPTVAVRWGQDALSFNLVDPPGHASRAPFDPWRYSGLAVPLACRAIRHAGGAVVAASDDATALSIAFPAAPPAMSGPP